MKREDLAVTYLMVVGRPFSPFVFGILLFSESCSPLRIAAVALIAIGMI